MPNRLYFGRRNRQHEHDDMVHYWILKDDNGKVVGESSQLYFTKLGSLNDAVRRFWREVLSGRHHIANDSDYNAFMDEAIRLEFIEEIGDDDDEPAHAAHAS